MGWVYWTATLSWLVSLGVAWLWGRGELPSVWVLGSWVLVHLAVNSFAVRTKGGIPFIADFPIEVAQAFVLSPVAAGLATTMGSLRPKEIRASVSKGLMNQSQFGLFAFISSLVAHQLPGSVTRTPWILLGAFIPLTIAVVVNGSFVVAATSLERKVSPLTTLRQLRLGTPLDFLAAFLTWGLLGGMLAVLYEELGVWSLGALLIPILFSGLALARSEALIDARHAFEMREQVLHQLLKRMHEERTDERRLIAAELHDEVLQPLFRVNLSAQIVKTDLDRGRLLELDEDLAHVIDASEEASATLRSLVGDLRQATPGLGDLAQSLQNLIGRMQSETGINLHHDLDPVSTDSRRQLVIYQIAKEAILNALSHSKASNIWIALRESGDQIQVEIIDDGRGFKPESSPSGHYGLQIMRERASALGGASTSTADLVKAAG